MSKLIEQAQKVFQHSGMRLTPQRRTILEVLDESETHLDAEALYHQAKTRDHNISLATVYRTLAALRQLGLIQQRHLTPDDQRGYYEIADQQHYHFTCLRCGRVIEFETPLIPNYNKSWPTKWAYRSSRPAFIWRGIVPCVWTK